MVSSASEFKQAILYWRSLQPGDQMTIERAAGSCILYCISENCYAIEDQNAPIKVWHLFDQETIESLLMTSHPDWKCSAKDLELGRELLTRSLKLPSKA
jgi:hypothetical protein